jgi:CDP-glucose 4,6-dehydratase
MGARVTGYALVPNTTPNLFDVLAIGSLIETSHIADIRDLGSLQQAMTEAAPEVVIHMAAQPLVRYSYANPVETYATNVMGTVHVLESARTIESMRATLVVTTDKCYENRERETGYREDEAMGGFDPYSSSKGCAELVTSAYRQSYFSKSVNHLASARAGNVIGGGDWAQERLLPDLIKSFLSGTTLSVRNPKSTRPWQHVLDPLRGYLIALEASLGKSEISAINFGPQSESLSVSRVVDIAQNAWNQETHVMTNVTSGDNQEAQELQLDSSYANGLLGWNPMWTQEEAIIATVDWWRKVEQNKIDPLTACLEDIDKVI